MTNEDLSLLQEEPGGFWDRQLLHLVKALDAREDIPRLISVLFLDFLIFNASHDRLYLSDHLEGALIFKRAGIGMEEKILE